jgi:hypothetical protein
MASGASIFFHSPCFDGIISCVLAWEFLESERGWVVTGLRPVDYGLRGKWLATELSGLSAVVDFLYHPLAQFWADHHVSTFLTEEARRDFRRRKRKATLLYSERMTSCALLLWRRLCSAGLRNRRYEEMVQWADKIDSARYESVEEAVLGDAPALRIRGSLMLDEDRKRFCERLVRELRGGTLEQVAELPEVKKRFARVRLLMEAGLDRLSSAAKLGDDEIVVFDVDSRDVMINRYAPYLFFPKARYSVGIVRSREGAKITAMRNPWRNLPSAPLGKIFANFGGGGHGRVGAVELPGSRASQAEQILGRVRKEIRKLDRATLV